MTTMRIRAAVARAAGLPQEVCEVELDPPVEGEVLVRLAYAGVCHSDLSVAEGATASRLPAVLGHEGAGVVESVGDLVRSVVPGDHVVVSWVATCRRCYQCLHGQPQLCLSGVGRNGAMDDGTTRLRLDGETLYHGVNAAAFAEKTVLRESAVVRIDPGIPLDQAAIAGCAVTTGVGAAVRAGEVRPGDRVAVIGCGGVGLNAVQGSRLAGAGRIIAVDPVQSRLDAALRFGATHAVLAGPEAGKAVRTLTDSVGCDVVIECVGRPELQRLAWDMTRRGGRTVLVGLAPQGSETSFPSVPLTIHERTLRGCFYGSCDPHRDIPWVLGLAAEGKLDLASLITQRLPLDGVNDAFDAMRRGEQIRTVLTLAPG